MLSQIIDKPDRGDNILDLVLVGSPKSVINCNILEQFSASDHQIIQLEMICPIPRVKIAARNITSTQRVITVDLKKY